MAQQHLYRRKPRPGMAANLTWHAYFTDGAGNRVRFSTGCTDKQAAAKVLAERERAAATAAAAGLAQDAATKSVDDVLRNLVERVHTSRGRGKLLADGTRTMYRQKWGHLGRLLKTCGGCAAGDTTGSKTAACDAQHPSLPIAHLSKAHVLGYIDQRLDEGAQRTSIKKELVTLASALGHGIDRGWITETAAKACMPKFAATSQAKQRWLTIEEFGRLVAALDTPARVGAHLSDIAKARKVAHHRAEVVRRQLFVWLGCLTGAELGALERMTWDDVNVAAGMIHVPGSKTEARDRLVPIAPDLLEQLLAVPEAQRHGLIIGVWGTAHRCLATACKRAGIDKISPHTLRHTFGSWLVQRGVDLFTVAKLMGHRSTAMIQKHYGHLSPKNHADAIARLPRLVPTAPIRCVTGVPNPSETPGADGAHGVVVDFASAHLAAATSWNIRHLDEEPMMDMVGAVGLEPTTNGLRVRTPRSAVAVAPLLHRALPRTKPR